MFKELLSKIDAKLLRRFGYYFGGLALGVIALSYINKQKGTTFNYGPNSRVLSQIRLKDTLKTSEKAQLILDQYHLDSLDIQYVLKKGDWIYFFSRLSSLTFNCLKMVINLLLSII